MKIGNNEFEIENITGNDENIKEEVYQLTSIISPIFGRYCHKLTSTPLNIKKNNNNCVNLKQDVNKKSKENIFHEKEVAYNNFSNIDNAIITDNKKDKAQQQISNNLLSHHLSFDKKIVKKNTTINVSNLNNNDTVITTIDLLIADILDESK